MNIPKNAKDVFISGLMTLGLITWQGLYNNLQAQNSKDSFVDVSENTTVSLKNQKDKVLQSVNSNIANDINKLRDYRYNHAHRNDIYKDVVWRALTSDLDNKMKAYLLLVIFDIKKESPYLKQATNELMNHSAVSKFWLTRSIRGIELGNSIANSEELGKYLDKLILQLKEAMEWETNK